MKEEGADQVWARLGAATTRSLSIRCAELGIKRPEAVKQAVEQWLQRAPSEVNASKVGIDASVIERTELKPPHGKVERLTEEEWRWVRRVLHVVRGGVAAGPLDTNLDAFVTLTDLVRGINVASGDASSDASSVEGAFGALERFKDKVGRSMGDLQGNVQDAQRAAEDLRNTRTGVQRSGKRNEGGAGGRG